MFQFHEKMTYYVRNALPSNRLRWKHQSLDHFRHLLVSGLQFRSLNEEFFARPYAFRERPMAQPILVLTPIRQFFYHPKTS